MMAAWKLGPPLAAGCTVILKPASLSPISTLMLAELIAEAGFPPRMVKYHHRLDRARQARHALRRRDGQARPPGKAPLIVFDDADVDVVAAKAALAGTMNTGQDCTAATRIYAQKGKLKQVTEAVAKAVRGTKIGEPMQDGVLVGPLISESQRETVTGFVDRARAAGGVSQCGDQPCQSLGLAAQVRQHGI
jgi:betaine-aldehyde dehydrogenase